jgi:hypothetical protein
MQNPQSLQTEKKCIPIFIFIFFNDPFKKVCLSNIHPEIQG